MKTVFSRSFVTALLAFAIASPALGADKVKMSEEQVVIPTYLIGPPDPNPQFYFGGGSQGAQHRMYPYPVYDNLTSQKADKSYKMVTLENEYVKVGILPDLGGKIFEAIDKTNGYNFFYRQHVIKPALISLLGAWISGGVEWDVPHHHRATSFLPMQYTKESGADGSQTVWVGELELRDRMRWAVGITLHPGKSYIEASFRVINGTPLPTSMLCFSNVAVSVNDNYQVIFPPSTQHVTYHTKNQFTTWPIATGRFNNADFGTGVDASWYKNHVGSMSMFAWNFQDDFLAGYDHGKQAGTMAIADHNVVPGKKFWTWGNGPQGHQQDTLLTDSDGPYIELMVGAYSDNQPDYSWLQPYEAREWTQYWYPFRDIDGAKNANIDAAVNLDVKDGKDGKAKVGFCVTSEHKGATVDVTVKGETVLKEKVDIGPRKPWVGEVALPVGVDAHDVRATLLADGKELVAYSPVVLKPEAMPAPVTPFPAPEQIKTNEELYLAGLRNDQFRAPGAGESVSTPAGNSRWDPYWEEALKRDPGDVRVNTAMGIECIRGGRFADAEKYLRAAVVRVTDRYTTPKDGEPLYYLGLALKMEGKTDEAFDRFSKATWSGEWKGPGYMGMAQIASMRGDYGTALTYVDDALSANAQNTRALGLKASLLRHTGRNSESLAAVAAIHAIDPLDVHGSVEGWMIHRKLVPGTMDAFPNTGLEVAADYMNAGLWADGTAVLLEMIKVAPDQSKVSPPVYYYLGYFAQKMGSEQKAAEYYAQAEKSSPEYVFPFQMEMIAVLESAMAANPTDARAPYYLGNLLYDSQPQRAVSLWEKSASLGADFPVVYHNLALAYTRQGQADMRDKALGWLEKAASLGGNAMVFNELDKLYEENGVSAEERLAIMDQHQPVINRDEVIAREINLAIFEGHYEGAIGMIESRLFRAWEGGPNYSLGDSWINANVMEGRQALLAGENKEALTHFQAAGIFPASMQSATGNAGVTRAVEINYWIGNAYEALGNREKAREAWADAAKGVQAVPAFSGRGGGGGLRNGRVSPGGLGAGVHVAQSDLYYQGLAKEKLGQREEAKVLFQQLADAGANSLKGAPVIDAKSPVASAERARVADAHYLAGLGALGLSREEDARREFLLALQCSPDHLAAKTTLAAITR